VSYAIVTSTYVEAYVAYLPETKPAKINNSLPCYRISLFVIRILMGPVELVSGYYDAANTAKVEIRLGPFAVSPQLKRLKFRAIAASTIKSGGKNVGLWSGSSSGGGGGGGAVVDGGDADGVVAAVACACRRLRGNYCSSRRRRPWGY